MYLHFYINCFYVFDNRHCIDTLGEDVFAKIQAKLKANKQDIDPLDLR